MTSTTHHHERAAAATAARMANPAPPPPSGLPQPTAGSHSALDTFSTTAVTSLLPASNLPHPGLAKPTAGSSNASDPFSELEHIRAAAAVPGLHPATQRGRPSALPPVPTLPAGPAGVNTLRELANAIPHPLPIRHRANQLPHQHAPTPHTLQQCPPPPPQQLPQPLQQQPPSPAIPSHHQQLPEPPPPPPSPSPPPSPPPPPLIYLPLACKPTVTGSVQYYNLGAMTFICQKCQAFHWQAERLKSYPSTASNPLYGTCCLSGKISLPKLQEPPLPLRHLLHNQDSRSPFSLSIFVSITQY